MRGADHKFYGAVTLGERGQVVIPQEARDEMGLRPGDKLLIFQHGPIAGALVLMRAADVSRFVQQAIERFTNLQRAVVDHAAGEDSAREDGSPKP